MYESFFKTIELSMQPAISMAEINGLAMERIANQQTECLSGCMKTGIEQWFAYTDMDEPQSLAEMQFKYLKFYEQQLSLTAESNMQTLSQASEAIQKIMGASLNQFSDSNPFMALMADLGGSSSAAPFFDWFKESVAATQSVSETVAQSAASAAAVKPAVPTNSAPAKPKAASRASAPSKSTASSRSSSTSKASTSKSTNSTASKKASTSPAKTAATPKSASSSKGASSKASATNSGTDNSIAASGASAKEPANKATPQRAAAPAKNSPASPSN